MHSNYNQLPYSYYTPLELNSVKERETQDVGVFNPVFVSDLIKEKNVDYLEHLCSLCEEIRINPIWFDSQNSESKHKIIQIYQLAIQYSSNTDSIYQIACEQISRKTAEKMKSVQNLKREIAEHKEEIDEKKKKFKRERLQKEKNKARKYELELIKIRNRLLQEQAQKQQNYESSSESEQHHHMMPPSYMHYPPHYYPHMTPYQHNPHPNQPIPFFGGNIPSNTHSQASLYQNMNGNMQHPQMPFPHLPVPNSGAQNSHSNPNLHNPNPNISSFQAQTEQKNMGTRQSVNRKDTKNSKASNFSLTDSNVVGHQEQEFEQSIQLRQDSIRRGTGQFNRGDSNNTNIINSQTTKFHDQSQRFDVVDELVDLKNSGMGKGRLSRKQSMISSDCGGEGDSMMNIILGPNSARDPDQMPKDLSKHKTSIIKKIPEQNEKYSLKSSSFQLKNSNQKYSTPVNEKFRGLDMQIYEKQGEPEDSSKYSLIHSKQKNQPLLMSNQGGKKVDFIGRLEFKDDSMKSDFMMNSMQDIQSPRKSHLGQSTLGEPKQNIQEKQDQYESDFDDSSDNKEPVIKILSSRNTSTIMPPKYLALAKGYFMPKLKSDFLSPDFNEESIGDSVIGSLKELTVHMSATGQKKSHKNPAVSSKISDFDLEMDMIQMPENSRIARPSYDKKSTIRKTINFKITDSLESNNNLKLPPRQSNQTKSQRNHVIETPEIQLLKKKSEEISIEKLADVALAESHVLQQTQYEIKDEPDQKIELSQFNKQDSINLQIEDEQPQQTKINLKSKKRQHILELIENRLKIEVDKSQHFDTFIIKNAIKKQIKNTDELQYRDVTEIFDKKTEKLKQKLLKLKNENKKKQAQRIQRENQKIIEKQKSRESNLEKTKKSSEEDLTYSRSMIQDPNKMGTKATLEKSNQSGQNKDEGKEFIQLSGSILTKKKAMTEISEVSAQLQKQSKDIKTEIDSIMPSIPMKSKVNSKPSQSKEAPKYAMTSSKEQVNTSQINRKNKLNIDDELAMALPITEQKQEDEDDF